MVLLQDGTTSNGDVPLYARDGWRIPTENVPKEAPELVKIRATELAKWHPKAQLRSIGTSH